MSNTVLPRARSLQAPPLIMCLRKEPILLSPLLEFFIQIVFSVVRTEFSIGLFNVGLWNFSTKTFTQKKDKNCLDTYYSQQKCFPTCSLIALETAIKASQITNKNFA